MVAADELKKTRETLQILVREIENLANAGGPPDQFFPAFLERLLVILGAPGGAVWLRNGQGIVPICEHNLQQLGVMATAQSKKLNDQFIRETVESGEAKVRAADQGSPTPTAHVYLLAALHKNKEPVGAVEIFQRPDSAKEARPGFLQFMEQMCGHASRYLQLMDAHKAAQAAPDEFWAQFEPFVLRLQRTLDIEEVAATAANDARQLIGCDRTSVAVYRFNKTRVAAVSGADSVNRRANLVRALEKLTHRVIAGREPMHYTGKMDQYSPQIEGPLADYISESGARMISILPLFEPPPLISPTKKEDEEKRIKRPRHPVGALIVEQMADGTPKPGMLDRATLVADHTGAALHNAILHHKLFLLPVWRALGHFAEKVRGRLGYKILAGVAAVALITAALVYIPWEYKAEAKGRLMPASQTDVFAPWDAQVHRLLVTSGQKVQAGDLLLELRSPDLEAKYLAAQNRLSELGKQQQAHQADLDEAVRRADRNKITELQGKLQQTNVAIEGGLEQVGVLRSQVELLQVKAPSAGTITTFQLEQLLSNRPVQRGEVLMEIMQEDGPWRLELEVPDHRMGHILYRQQELKQAKLPLQFMMATSAEVTYEGQLDTSSTRTVLTQDTGSVVEAFADINPEDFKRLADNRRVGAEVTAWVLCGKKPLGYVLFGDVIEFLQKKSMLW